MIKQSLSRFYGRVHRRWSGRGFGWGLFTWFHFRVWERFLKPQSMVYEGVRLSLPEGDRVFSTLLLLGNKYEGEVLEALHGALKPGMTFLDLGANIGLHSVFAAQRVGPQGQVFAFEPFPANIELLMRNLRQNHCSNVTVFPYAVGNRLECRSLFLAEDSPARHALQHRPSLGPKKTLPVVVVALAEFFREPVLFDVVKIDVEGAELEALQGMAPFLQQPQLRMLIVESHPEVLQELRMTGREIPDLLEKYGFRSQQLDPTNLLFTR